MPFTENNLVSDIYYINVLGGMTLKDKDYDVIIDILSNIIKKHIETNNENQKG